MDLKLDRQTALVTGSTAGIGLGIARRLADEGADVIVSGRGKEKVDAAVASIRDSGGGSVRGVVADVTTADGAATLLGAAGQVDILVNNLGIYESKAFGDITDDDWMHFFEVNVVSGARLARAVFPGMLGRNHGRIIFVSSESALSVPKDMIHYAVTKTAQLTIARGLAELSKGTQGHRQFGHAGADARRRDRKLPAQPGEQPVGFDRDDRGRVLRESAGGLTAATHDRARGNREPRRLSRQPPCFGDQWRGRTRGRRTRHDHRIAKDDWRPAGPRASTVPAGQLSWK